MKYRILALSLVIALLLCGCVLPAQSQTQSKTFFDLFNTVTQISSLSTTDFAEVSQSIYDSLLHLHRLFDIYTNYEGIHNIKTINDQAGIAPVVVEKPIIDLLLDCKAYYTLTNGKVNVAMGSVLKLWHSARETGILPDKEKLQEASLHTSWDSIIIEQANNTVFIRDKNVSLDVGAIAKGWAVQYVAEKTPSGYLLNVGGNVCATGPKTKDAQPWVVGVNDPKSQGNYLHTLSLTEGSMVTSGDYQRYFEHNGTRYHHIIDPDTQMPSTLWSSVTILCQDSALADALSTSLFLMDMVEGLALLKACNAEAIWVDTKGEISYSPGIQSYILS